MKLFPIVCLFSLSAALGWAGDAPKKHNVLLIMADDLNRRIEPLGDPNAITPNLTRFAERSVHYRNCIVNYSLCAASRGSMLTGIYPWKLGVHNGGTQHARPLVVVPGRPWISTHFRNNGYFAGSYGKIEHLGIAENWDELVPRVYPVHPEDKLVTRSNWGGRKGVTGDTAYEVYDVHPDEFMDGRAVTSALQAMEHCLQDDEPFFIGVGMYLPHAPWFVPKCIADLYDPATLVLPENPPGSYSDTYWPTYVYPKGTFQDQRPWLTDGELRGLMKAYYSAVTLVDNQVGRLLDFADANNLWENTVIIFVSDNGFSLMEHRHLYSKRNYSRESLHVPLMIHNPGMTTEGRVCDRQVSLIDFLPTTIELAGLDPFPKPVDGQSIVPLQNDPDAEWNTPALSCITHPLAGKPRFRIAQLGEWKLIEGPWHESFHRVMNHETDPFEHFPTFPNGIPDEIRATMEDALRVIPFQNGVFYTERPTTPDRDGDGLLDELEIDLAMLGFNPFQNDSQLLARFQSDGVFVGRAPSQNRIQLKSLLPDPDLYQPYHDYPIFLQRSSNLSNWYEFSIPPDRNSMGFLEWIDPASQSPDAYYRISLGR